MTGLEIARVLAEASGLSQRVEEMIAPLPRLDTLLELGVRCCPAVQLVSRVAEEDCYSVMGVEELHIERLSVVLRHSEPVNWSRLPCPQCLTRHSGLQCRIVGGRPGHPVRQLGSQEEEESRVELSWSTSKQ